MSAVTIGRDIKISPVQFNSGGHSVTVTLDVEKGESIQKALDRCQKEVDTFWAKRIPIEFKGLVEDISKGQAAGRQR